MPGHRIDGPADAEDDGEAGSIVFANRVWAVKDSGKDRVGPGNNYFARASVAVKREGLQLRARVNHGRLECAEVILLDDLSYGVYRFTVASDLTRLASSLTFGMFQWADDEGFADREIDIEAGRWGRPGNQDMQFVVQPHTVPGNLRRFALGAFNGPSVHEFAWTPGRVEFQTSNGGVLVQRFAVTRGVPPPGGAQHVRINLWNTTHELAEDGVAEVLVTDFCHEPRR